jgi:predicted transposase YbfD/YdcC
MFDSGEEIAHGRIERRICEVIVAPDLLGWLWFATPLPGMARVAMIRRFCEDESTGKGSRETAFRMFDIRMSAREALAVDRWHWTIENSVHHVLDTAFAEDACRIGGAAARLRSSMRRLAIPILRRLMPDESIATAGLSVLIRQSGILPIRLIAVSGGDE